MKKECYHDIQKIHEGEDYCIYSFKTNDSDKVEEVEITGFGRHLIDALGNAMLKKSFQDFEK